jgi:hypothetical protein
MPGIGRKSVFADPVVEAAMLDEALGALSGARPRRTKYCAFSKLHPSEESWLISDSKAPGIINFSWALSDFKLVRACGPWSLADCALPQSENRQAPREQLAGGQRPRHSSNH